MHKKFDSFEKALLIGHIMLLTFEVIFIVMGIADIRDFRSSLPVMVIIANVSACSLLIFLFTKKKNRKK